MAMTVGELNVEIGAKLNKLDRALNEMDRKLANSKRSAGNLNKGFGDLTTSVKGFAAAAGLAFGAREIFNFTKDAIRLAGEMEGVRRAYERVADPTLMYRLKEATRGTVTELQLMKTVTTASNFGIALEQLPTLLEFARRRAKDTGVEVDVLVEKIIKGIGRKSVLILDDLNVSASQIKKELGGVAVESASVADITRAIGSIARESYADFTEGAMTSAEKTAQLNAELENQKVIIGQQLTPAYLKLLKVGSELLTSFSLLIDESIPLEQRLALLDPVTGVLTLQKLKMVKATQKATEAIKKETEALERTSRIADIVFRSMARISDSVNSGAESWESWSARIEQAIKKANKQLKNEELSAKQKALIHEQIEAYRQLLAEILAVNEEGEEKIRDFTDATLEQLEAMRDMGKMANLTEKELDNLGKRLDELSSKILIRASLRSVDSLFDKGTNQKETTDGIDRDAGIAYEDEMASAIASSNAFLEANKGLLEKLQQNRNAVFQLASTISGTLGNAFASAIGNMQNFGQIMLDTLKSILQQLIAVVAQAAILAVIMNIINPGSATFKGAFKTILGFAGGLEQRASGGPVNFGQAYLVGERGPELFMPGRSGSIMPNNKLGMMGATVAVGGRLLGQDILISNARSQQGLSRQTGR